LFALSVGVAQVVLTETNALVVMTTLAVATDGLPIYDVAGQPLYQTPQGGVADVAGNTADINPANGLPRAAAGNDIPLLRLAGVSHVTKVNCPVLFN
jgi:hypothetical protein